MRLTEISCAALLVVAITASFWMRGQPAFGFAPTAQPVAPEPAGVVRTAIDDHPVGVPLTRFSGTSGRADLPGLNRAVINGQQVWWIDMEDVPNGQRDETDLILYTRRDGGRPLPYVECATCHDPDAVDEGALRTSNRGSRMCLACHPR